MRSLTIAERVATISAFKSKEQAKMKKGLEEGEHVVDMVVRVKGTINKEPTKEGIIAQKAAPWKLLAVALSMLNGVSIEALVCQAEEISEEDLKQTKDEVRAALETIKGSVVGVIAGRTIAEIDIEKLEDVL